MGGSGDHDPQTTYGGLVKLQCFCGVLSVSTKRISEHTEARVESGPDSQVLTAISIMGQVRSERKTKHKTKLAGDRRMAKAS